MVQAAVLDGPRSLRIDELDIEAPRRGEVLVRLRAAGVCHSDLSVYEAGGAGMALPVVLGHEGAGIVEEVGDGVEQLTPGDHVVLCVTPQCGACFHCRRGQPTLCDSGLPVKTGQQSDGTTRLTGNGRPVAQMSGLGTWAERAVVSGAAVVRIDASVPFPQAALIGCAVVTGYGAAVNVGQVAEGDTVAVIGCGGVGLAGVQGARIRCAARIVAVDVARGKLDRAVALGATDAVDASGEDATARVLELTAGRGADVVLDFVGSAATMTQAVAMARRGGVCVATGLGAAEWPISLRDFLIKGKTLKANYMGMGRFEDQFGDIVRHYRTGGLLLDELVSQRIRLADVESAFTAMSSGEVARSVIEFG